MSWATHYITQLQAGKTVQFRPRGNSMQPRIESGNLCTVKPVNEELAVDMIVLCRVAGVQYLHLLTAIRQKKQKDGTVVKKYRICNNKGHVNGWINADAIYGICTKVEP